MCYKIIAPTYIDAPRKTKKDKRYYINLNTYRNLHYIINNQLKDLYKKQLYDQLKDIPKLNRIELTYKPYYGKAGRHDKSNVISVTQKYFLDALVEYWIIVDDTDEYVLNETMYPWEVDRVNPRVEIYIKEVY